MRRFLPLLAHARPIESASQPRLPKAGRTRQSGIIPKRDTVAEPFAAQSFAQRFRRFKPNGRTRARTPYLTFAKWFVITGIWTATAYYPLANRLSIHRIKGSSMAPTLYDKDVEAGTERDWVWFHPIPSYQSIDTAERKWVRTYKWTLGPEGEPVPHQRDVDTTTESVRREQDVQSTGSTDVPDILCENIPYIRRGSIVLFHSPTRGAWAVKRVIGLPGDRIRPLPRPKRRDDLGEIIKRRPYTSDRRGFGTDSPLLSGKGDDSETEKTENIADGAGPSGPQELDAEGYMTVPYHHVWVEGDNQRKSFDSNDWGVLSKTMIHAKADHIVLPMIFFQELKHWAGIDSSSPYASRRRRRDWEDDGWEKRVGDRVLKRPDNETAAEMVPTQWA